MKFKTSGKFIKYYPETDLLMIKLDPMHPDYQENLEYIMRNFNSYLSISVDYNAKQGVHYKEQCNWYWCLKQIIIARDQIPSSQAVKNLDEQERDSIFPLEEDTNTGVPVPMRMRKMSTEQIKSCITVLKERHKKYVKAFQDETGY